jgi:KAP-like P-loop domain-containing protein
MKLNIRYEIQGSPKGYDVVFSSVDQFGSPGILNRYIMSELGLKMDLLNYLDLSTGISSKTYTIKKKYVDIIYLVTIGNQESDELLSKNFTKAINQIQLVGNKIWIPLMGVGDGGITIKSSFNIIFKSLLKYQKSFEPNEVVISIPKETDKETLKYIDEMISLRVNQFENDHKPIPEYKHQFDSENEEQNEDEEEPEIEDKEIYNGKLNNLINSGKNFYTLGNHKVIGQKKHSLKKGIWENGNNKKLAAVVNRVKVGDVVFLESMTIKKGSDNPQINAIGVVTENPGDGNKLFINWELIKKIDISIVDHIPYNIYQIDTKDKRKVLEKLSLQLPKFFDIVERLGNQIEIRRQVADKEYFTKKFNGIAQSKEFYFQKALDVLEKLKEYGTSHGSYDIRDIDSLKNIRIAPYRILRDIWQARNKITPKQFSKYLEKEQSDLVTLYTLINKFLSYVDSNALDRQNLNEYENKRCIAKTNVRQTYLIDHFLSYALNNFELNSNPSQTVFNNVIEYLHDPKYKFNIVSKNHQLYISRHFLGKALTGLEFHSRLKNHFGQFGYSVNNPLNGTCFYTCIIYETSVRQLWDPKLADAESADAESEEFEPDLVDDKASDEVVIIQPTGSVINSNDLAHAENDLLNFESDIKVLAALIALKKMDPPLAIAVFGKWGTGKSFFMHQLESRIKELSEYQGFIVKKSPKFTKSEVYDKDKYCRGIAQINFNAWSYIDSNLWAGLVNTIFEKLNEYLTDTTKSGVAKLKVREKFIERLATLQSKSLSEKERKSGLELLRDEYENEKIQIENSIQTNFTNQILEIIGDNKKLKQLHNKLDGQDTSIIDVIGIKDSKIVQEYAFWKNFWINLNKTTNYGKYIFGVVLVAAVLLGISLFITKVSIGFGAWFTTILLGLSKVGVSVSSVSSRYYRVKSYAKKLNSFIIKNESQKKSVGKIEKLINNAKNEIDEANDQIHELDKKIDSLEYKLSKSLTDETISDFINDRAKSTDYDKHLGIVSVIRKDFETLSGLFFEKRDDENDESSGDENDENNELTQLRITEEQKLEDDRKIINDQFKKGRKLERIVLYIDDLDRCSDQKVLEVLQAVHLLMAFPLFIVVVGVDKRCVNNALNYKNILQYLNSTGAKNQDQLKKEFDIEVIKPNNYLEKIFQIPFQIPDADPGGVHRMIDDLFKGQINDEESEEKVSEDELSGEESDSGIDSSQEVSGNKMTEEVKTEPENDNQEIEPKDDDVPGSAITEPESTPPVVEIKPETPPDLSITSVELLQIKNLSGLVGKIPRTIKRFVNLYRILRAHSELKHDSLLPNEKLTIMFALAINIGDFKSEAEKLFIEIKDKETEPLSVIITRDNYSVFYQELTNNHMADVLNITCKEINNHLPFILRFSFGETYNGSEEKQEVELNEETE